MKANLPKLRPNRSAFTLMEMMLVLAIIALLIAVGAVTLKDVQGGASITAAEAQMNTIKTAILQYRTHNRTMPGELEFLVKPPPNARIKRQYIDESGIIDPWGEKYQLRNPGKKNPQGFDIFSMGPDKKEGTDDDIYSSN